LAQLTWQGGLRGLGDPCCCFRTFALKEKERKERKGKEGKGKEKIRKRK
jgi:hypothetical protein